MTTRYAVVSLFFLLFVCSAAGQNSPASRPVVANRQIDKDQLPSTYIPSGKRMYKEHCAACHGPDGRGRGPLASSLTKQPPDLTTLAKRHGGQFPEEYVTAVLRFGPGFSAHGSSEMPVWGPIFQYLENYNEAAVRQRIKNLCEFLESIQQR